MNQNDRIVIRGAVLTKRGERVLSIAACVAFFAILGVIGGIEAGTIWPFNKPAAAAEIKSAPASARIPQLSMVIDRRVKTTRASRAATNKLLGKAIARQYGITGAQWACLDRLWHRESRWDHLARNKESGALGIPQKMNNTSPVFKVDPAAQIRWGIEYIQMRYTTPCRAMNFHLAEGWY